MQILYRQPGRHAWKYVPRSTIVVRARVFCDAISCNRYHSSREGI
jgi:hypothetical protein